MAIYKIDGTSVQLNISDEVAEAYHAFNAAIGKLTTEELLKPFQLDGVTDRQRELYDKYATMMNLMVELNDGGIDCSLPLDRPINLIKV